MRIIVLFTILIIFSIVSLPLYLLAYLLGKINEMRMHKIVQRMIRGIFRFFLWFSGTCYQVIGKDRIPLDKGGVLFVANHRSFFDILLTYATTPLQTCFIAKKELKKFPCVAQWMYFLRCLFLDRDDVRQGLQVILTAIDQIKAGYSICVAPEGTRNPTDELLPFKEGSLKIALKTKCPIVPVVVNRTERIFEDHLPWIKPQKVIIEYGEPVYFEDLSAEEKKHLGSYMRDIVGTIYQKNEATLN